MRYLLIITSVFFFSACQHSIKQANKRGLEYMKQNQYELAIKEFNAAINEKPDWYPAYYNRAISKANLQRYQEALNDLEYILTNFPDHADAYFNQAIIYENLGKYAKAIKSYSETIKLRPNFISAYHYRGIARFRMNDFDGALQDYNKALQLGNHVEMDVLTAKEYGLNSSALYFNRGVVLQKKGEHKSAIQDYTKAIEIDPSNGRIYYNRAISQIALSEQEKAIKDLEISHRLGCPQATYVLKNHFPNR